MAKKTKETSEEKMYHKAWVRLVLAAVFLGLAYGFFSLAVDDGNLIEWALGLLFVGWAINNIVRVVFKR